MVHGRKLTDWVINVNGPLVSDTECERNIRGNFDRSIIFELLLSNLNFFFSRFVSTFKIVNVYSSQIKTVKRMRNK